MFERQRAGAILCPSCAQLVGVNDERCLSCGRSRPGMWGFIGVLKALGDDMAFVNLAMWACGALYLAMLAADPEGIGSGGLLSLLSPSMESLERFGASGARPVFVQGRVWTLLSATWLHAGLLHIVFNMMSLRNLGPAISHLYGPARTIIIYTVAGVVGFAASSAAAFLVFLPRPLRGAAYTLGASAAICGLLGALLCYGRRALAPQVSAMARRWALNLALFGFLVPGIDNWAHLGGFAGGYLCARWLDPLKVERGDHALLALACIVASAAAVILSVATG